MQSRQKALNLLGLAQRAGELDSGTDTVIAGLRGKQVKVVILANDIYADSSEKITRVAKQNNVKIIDNFSSEELSHAIGKKRKVLGLTDDGFCKALVKKINEGV